MLKRSELYADAALLSFPVALLIVLLGSSVRLIGTLDLVWPAAAIGGLLSIWLARMLHHAESREHLTRREMIDLLPIAIAVGLGAVLLLMQMSSGGGPAWMWFAVAIPLMALTLAMFIDAIYDAIRFRTHKTDDAVRIVLIGLLGFSWLGGGLTNAWGPDVGPWVVGVTGYLLLVAAAAFAWDAIASLIAMRAERTHGQTPATTA